MIDTIARAAVTVAINALWQSALLAACVWLVLRLWPNVNAVTRYIIWSITLAAIVVVPIATSAVSLASQPVPATASPALGAVRQKPFGLRAGAVSVRQPAASAVEAAPRSAIAVSRRWYFAVPAWASLSIAIAWAALALVLLARLAVALAKVERLKRDALPLPIEYRDTMQRWSEADKGARDVRLCVSDDTDVPVAVGLFDAMILVPRSLLERLTHDEIDHIVLHELAHLRRADDWSNGLQRVFVAAFAWNPAVQFVAAQLDLEREVACDDWVLAQTRTVRPYAMCLTKMAETASWPHQPIPAPGVFTTRRNISVRIERLLAAGRNAATNLSLGPSAVAVAVVATLAIVAQFVAPSIAQPAPTAARVANASTPSPQAAAAPPRRVVRTPAVHLHVAASEVHVPAQNVRVPAQNVRVPGVDLRVPARTLALPSVNAAGLAGTIERKVNSALRAAGIVANTTACRKCSARPGSDFRGVDWAGRDMRGVVYTGVDLSSSDLAGTNFSGGAFNGVDFASSDLGGASFRNARLTGCNFSGSNLGGADFTGASVSGCRFAGANLGGAKAQTILNSCEGCDFSHATLRDMDLSGARARGDDFSGADLRNVNFSGAQLVGIDFNGALLAGANFAGATLNGCNLNGVDLSHVDLSKAQLIGIDLSRHRRSP